jgi:hypothetical protein
MRWLSVGAASHVHRPRRVGCRWLAVSVLGGFSVGVLAQALPPSPAELSEQAEPVRVVCLAESPEAFLLDASFRQRVIDRLTAATGVPAADTSGDPVQRLRPLIQPLGRYFYLPLGSGFVVDPQRRHVVSNWRVAMTCLGRPAVPGRQLGILDGQGASAEPLTAHLLPDRAFQDVRGRPLNLVQAVCRDRLAACDADLPQPDTPRVLSDADYRRQLDNVRAYAPDLAVLRLERPAQAVPLGLALNEQVDDQMRLVIRGFDLPVLSANTLMPSLGPATSTLALYTGPHQINWLPMGGQPGEEIHARLHRLAAVVHPGLDGAPVLRGAGVVGVLTALPGETLPNAGTTVAAPAFAVPVTVLAAFLDLLKVPYVTAVLELPVQVGAGDGRVSAATPPATNLGWDNQRLMLLGAAVLAVLAALAFAILAWRARRVRAVELAPARTVSRVRPELLHAVAMPTAAIEPGAAVGAADVSVPQATRPVRPLSGDVAFDPFEPGAPDLRFATTRSPARPVLVAAADAAPVQLHGSRGPLVGAVFTLPMPNGGTTLFVGRDARSCQVVFPPDRDRVSAVHLCLEWTPSAQRLSVCDLSSSGTWVNGQRIEKGLTVGLMDGDCIDLGEPESNRFTVELAAPSAVTTSEHVS